MLYLVFQAALRQREQEIHEKPAAVQPVLQTAIRLTLKMQALRVFRLTFPHLITPRVMP